MPVREVAGQPIYQAYIGSSANPGYRDFAMAAEIVKGRHGLLRTCRSTSIPRRGRFWKTSSHDGHLLTLIHAGARIHQAGCNGCIGMGQAPAIGKLSLRHRAAEFSRPLGNARRSGLPGQPGNRRGFRAHRHDHRPAHVGDALSTQSSSPHRPLLNPEMLIPPPDAREAAKWNWFEARISSPLPNSIRLPDMLEVVVLLKVGDNISTDEILPAGARVLPYRSNIPAISRFRV